MYPFRPDLPKAEGVLSDALQQLGVGPMDIPGLMTLWKQAYAAKPSQFEKAIYTYRMGIADSLFPIYTKQHGVLPTVPLRANEERQTRCKGDGPGRQDRSRSDPTVTT